MVSISKALGAITYIHRHQREIPGRTELDILRSSRSETCCRREEQNPLKRSECGRCDDWRVSHVPATKVWCFIKKSLARGPAAEARSRATSAIEQQEALLSSYRIEGRKGRKKRRG